MNTENMETREEGGDIICEDITELIVRRQDMTALSEYFGRDARRYDNGFETY